VVGKKLCGTAGYGHDGAPVDMALAANQSLRAEDASGERPRRDFAPAPRAR
jgi:hypothetical protein